MTTRKTIIEDLDDMTTILCSLNGIGKPISDESLKKAMCLAIWHIQEYLAGGKHEIQRTERS